MKPARRPWVMSLLGDRIVIRSARERETVALMFNPDMEPKQAGERARANAAFLLSAVQATESFSLRGLVLGGPARMHVGVCEAITALSRLQRREEGTALNEAADAQLRGVLALLKGLVDMAEAPEGWSPALLPKIPEGLRF